MDRQEIKETIDSIKNYEPVKVGDYEVQYLRGNGTLLFATNGENTVSMLKDEMIDYLSENAKFSAEKSKKPDKIIHPLPICRYELLDLLDELGHFKSLYFKGFRVLNAVGGYCIKHEATNRTVNSGFTASQVIGYFRKRGHIIEKGKDAEAGEMPMKLQLMARFVADNAIIQPMDGIMSEDEFQEAYDLADKTLKYYNKFEAQKK